MTLSGLSRACPLTGRALVVCCLGAVVAVGLALGFLAGSHFSPCNPRNLDRCGRRLASTLRGLDAASGKGQEASALCPSLAESLDCYFWFSQRCLPQSEQLFYSKAYVDANSVVQGLCRPDDDAPPLLVSHGHCLSTARTRRSECTGRFLDELQHQDAVHVHGDVNAHVIADTLVDSLYNARAGGTFQLPLCRALRELILCGLRLVSDTCGVSVALRVQDLHDNLTSLVFSSKCEPGLRPVLPQPVVVLHPADLMPATPRTYTLLSVTTLLVTACIVLGYRLLTRCKK